jgi:ribosome-associated protein
LIIDAESLAKLCAHAAEEKKAEDIVVLAVGQLVPITDFFVIATVQNSRQMKAVSEEIRTRLKLFASALPHSEGVGDQRWRLLDYGTVVVHLFDPESRSYYDLDSLWADAQRVTWRTEAVSITG